MEGATVWIAFGALLFTIFTVSGGGLWALFSRMETHKAFFSQKIDELELEHKTEIDSVRMAAFAEYKELRREMNEGWGKAYLEFGEAPKALREKITQVELFMRDTYVPLKLYERGQDQVLEAIRMLSAQTEKKLDSLEKKIDTLKSSVV